MLVINYNGKKPAQRNYEYCVVGNSNVDTIKFVLQSDICADYFLEDLSSFDAYVKIQSAGKEYIDKIDVGSLVEDNNGIYYLYLSLTKKMTHWKNISLQLQFESDEGNAIAQTEIVSLTLSGNIPADEEISDEYPYAIQQLESKVNTFDERITDVEEEVVKAKEVIITSRPISSLENEDNLNKIIRVRSGQNVENTYLIDKIHHESTLVKCEQHSTTNGYDYTGEQDDLVNDLGVEQFNEIFGDNYSFDELFYVSSLFYNEGGVITKGLCFGFGGEFGGINLTDCVPNKEITIVVGKYFEYNEQGEKVFDEHCILFSDTFAENPENTYREITEERQEFKLKTNNEGHFYFDSDGNDVGFGNTRFILYEIKTGEPAHDEYKARKIGGGNYLPTFKQTDKVQVLYDYYLEHKDEIDDGVTLNFAILGNDEQYSSCAMLANILFFDDDVHFNFNNWYGVGYGSFNKNEILEETILYLLDNMPNYIGYVFPNQLPQERFCTQEQYDNMSSHDANTTYYIYED